MRDLRLATLAMLALTAVLGVLRPARVSYATDTTITDHPVLPLAKRSLCGPSELQRPSSPAVRTCRRTAISSFTDWALRTDQRRSRRLATAGGSRLAALEAIAARLPAGIARERFTNPIGSDPLAADCLRAIGGEAGANGIARLLQLLAVSEAERKELKGLL